MENNCVDFILDLDILDNCKPPDYKFYVIFEEMFKIRDDKKIS